MTVEGILRAKGRDVETVRAEATVTMAIHLLTAKGIGALVVTTDAGAVEGVLSERDVVRGLARYGDNVLGMRVGDILSASVPVCAPDDTVKHVMVEMTQTRQRHLPVMDGPRLAGIISIGDVIKSRLEEIELEAAVLRDAYILHRAATR
ncbi:MAG: CBS domain-containing protein [Acidimicrobiia bacterium]